MPADKETTQPELENSAKINQIALEIIEPALQKALAAARKKGSAQEVLSALANCYGGLLVDIMGRRAAATYLQGHAVHIASVKEPALNS
tara:strand:- start:1006 stop:1272 length:267 start_codon:yes stop_codon:yes gene_type:complete